MEDIPFYLYEVTQTFNPASTFSNVDIHMAPYKSGIEGAYPVVRTRGLFNLDRLEKTAENGDAIEFIRNCKQKPWPPWSVQPQTEHASLMEISRRLFVPLCKANCVTLEKTYHSSLTPDDELIKFQALGMGSFKTWHGSPDAWLRGTEVVYNSVTGGETDTEVEENSQEEQNYDSDSSSGMTTTVEAKRDFGNSDRTEEEQNYDSDSSCGTTTTVEAKIHFKKKNLSQLVATCVVSSFIENKLHRNLPSAVPSILIDPTGFRVCFYDCQNDLLLISGKKSLQSQGREGLSRSAVLFLWLIINHR